MASLLAQGGLVARYEYGGIVEGEAAELTVVRGVEGRGGGRGSQYGARSPHGRDDPDDYGTAPLETPGDLLLSLVPRMGFTCAASPVVGAERCTFLYPCYYGGT